MEEVQRSVITAVVYLTVPASRFSRRKRRRCPSSSVNITGFCFSIFLLSPPPPPPQPPTLLTGGEGGCGGRSRLGGASVSPATFELEHRHGAAVLSEPYPTERVIVDLFIRRFSRVFFMPCFFFFLSVFYVSLLF